MTLRMRDNWTGPEPSPEPECPHNLADSSRRKKECLLLNTTEMWGSFLTQHYHSTAHSLELLSLRWLREPFLRQAFKVGVSCIGKCPKTNTKH